MPILQQRVLAQIQGEPPNRLPSAGMKAMAFAVIVIVVGTVATLAAMCAQAMRDYDATMRYE